VRAAVFLATALVVGANDGAAQAAPGPVAPMDPAPSSSAKQTEWTATLITSKPIRRPVPVADLDGDGFLDLVTADSLYRGPSWQTGKWNRATAQRILKPDHIVTPMDVNRDGLDDLVLCQQGKARISWWETPRNLAGRWPHHEVDYPGTLVACGGFDVNSDGHTDLVVATHRAVYWYERARSRGRILWKRHFVHDASIQGTLGFGDINGDARADIVTNNGWFEQPTRDEGSGWTHHENLRLSAPAARIVVTDINGDGLQDLLWQNQADGVINQTLQRSPNASSATALKRPAPPSSEQKGPRDATRHAADQPAVRETSTKRTVSHERDWTPADPIGRSPAGALFGDFSSSGSVQILSVQSRTPRRVIIQSRDNALGQWTLAVQWRRSDITTAESLASGVFHLADLDNDGDLDVVLAGANGLSVGKNPHRGLQAEAPASSDAQRPRTAPLGNKFGLD